MNGLIISRPITRRRKSTKINKDIIAKKNYARYIYLPLNDGQKYKVCRKFFLNTLCIGEDTFKKWTKYDVEALSENSEDIIVDNIKTFQQLETSKSASPRHQKKIQDTELVIN